MEDIKVCYYLEISFIISLSDNKNYFLRKSRSLTTFVLY